MKVKFSLDDGFCKGPTKSLELENVILVDHEFSLAYGCDMLCIISKREDGEFEKRLFPSALVSSLTVTDGQWEKEYKKFYRELSEVRTWEELADRRK